jgi:hypothetical protein
MFFHNDHAFSNRFRRGSQLDRDKRAKLIRLCFGAESAAPHHVDRSLQRL